MGDIHACAVMPVAYSDGEVEAEVGEEEPTQQCKMGEFSMISDTPSALACDLALLLVVKHHRSR